MSLVGPYLAIAALVIVGFFVQAKNSDRIERESKERALQICEDGNERAAGARAFVLDIQAGGGRVLPVGEARELQALLDRRLPIKDCSKLVTDRR